MDQNDDDLPMHDAPEHHLSGSTNTGETAKEIEPQLTPGLPRPTRLRNSPRLATPGSDNEMTNPSIRRVHDRSRESSTLATSVANNLSIESPNNENDEQLNGFINDSDAEHEPTAPYTSTLPTGLCYDVRMRYHCELDPPKQRLDYHPEDPRRIFKIYKELCMAGLVKDELLNTGTVIPNPLMPIPAREVTEAEVCLIHDKRHFSFMKTTASW